MSNFNSIFCFIQKLREHGLALRENRENAERAAQATKADREAPETKEAVENLLLFSAGHK